MPKLKIKPGSEVMLELKIIKGSEDMPLLKIYTFLAYLKLHEDP